MAAVFIGIGGTGDWILTSLKEKLRAAHGEIPQDIQFRLLDTIAPDKRNDRAARIGEEIGISAREYLQLRDHPPGNFHHIATTTAQRPEGHPHLARWFKAKLFIKHLSAADFNLVDGAGQHRQFGRMGMFLNKQLVLTLVDNALRDCKAREAGQTAIWIVGSVAGGTGAGIFADMALLARHAAISMGITYRILGALVLPSAFSHTTEKDPARAYAAMREIARFQTPMEVDDLGYDTKTGQAFRFAVDYDEATRFLQTGKLFDSLVFYDRECADETQMHSYYSQIADGLNLILDPAVNNKMSAEWINAEEGFATSFNSYSVILPARLYERLFLAEAQLEAINALLPLDGKGSVDGDSRDDRRADAQGVAEGFGPLVARLAKLKEDGDYKKLDEEANSSLIVDNLLGFFNAEVTYDAEATPKIREQAAKLHRSLTEDIPKFGDKGNRDDYPTSKQEANREVIRRRQLYEGDGEASFAKALKDIRPIVVRRLQRYVDDTLANYFRSQRAENKSLGQAIKMLGELREVLNRCKDARTQLGKNDDVRLNGLRQDENSVLEQMQQAKKPLLVNGDLPKRQQDYFAAVEEVTAQWQRIELMAFIEELLGVVEQRCGDWQGKTVEWQTALDKLRGEAKTAIGEIDQQLNSLTLNQSSSLGVGTTKDMGGYQQFLRERCVVNPSDSRPLVKSLLGGLVWRWDAATNGLRLTGWPDTTRPELIPRDLPPALADYLFPPIGENMRKWEGMANYLAWLRDVRKSADKPRLMSALTQVTKHFLDPKNSDTRRFLLLYGDDWVESGNFGNNELDEIGKEIAGDPDSGIGSKLTRKLETQAGINLFKDKNLIALLATDNKIAYKNIPVLDRMYSAYVEMRSKSEHELPWRARAYHLFRCEQEAWEIERRRALANNDAALPLLPGEYYRVLDEPDWVKLFAKALVVGLVRQAEVAAGQMEWVCGPLEAAQPIRLTDRNRDRADLFRALVTFVLDKKDRRTNNMGKLVAREVSNWIEQAAAGKPWQQWVDECRQQHPGWFEPELNPENPEADEFAKRYAKPRQAFIAWVLDHYLDANWQL